MDGHVSGKSFQANLHRRQGDGIGLTLDAFAHLHVMTAKLELFLDHGLSDI
jgi:hypothetical protein